MAEIRPVPITGPLTPTWRRPLRLAAELCSIGESNQLGDRLVVDLIGSARRGKITEQERAGEPPEERREVRIGGGTTRISGDVEGRVEASEVRRLGGVVQFASAAKMGGERTRRTTSERFAAHQVHRFVRISFLRREEWRCVAGDGCAVDLGFSSLVDVGVIDEETRDWVHQLRSVLPRPMSKTWSPLPTRLRGLVKLLGDRFREAENFGAEIEKESVHVLRCVRLYRLCVRVSLEERGLGERGDAGVP